MSKVVKKITKPISKVFDKIIPNEIKPLLPYAAAFVPMLAPTSGFMGSMMGRALLSGGANAAAQLAQEGNEGDLNYLSTLMASGIGALSAPGAGDALRGQTMANDPSMLTKEGIMTQMSNAPIGANSLDAAQPFLGRTTDSALNFFAKGADSLQALNAAGAADPFSMAGLKAASIPFAQGTGDLMYQEGVNAMRDYEIALADYERNLAEGEEATNAGRRQAIIDAMTGNHSQQVIDDTLEELGLRDGGRVAYNMGGRIGFAFGGIPAAVQNVKDKQLTSNLETAQGMEMPIEDLVQEFIELKKRKPNDYDELMDFYRQKYGTGSQISSMTEEMTEEFAANGGMMGRKPFVSGGIGKGIMRMFSKSDDAVDVQKQFEQFREGPITAKFLEDVDQGVVNKFIRTRDTGGVGGYGMYDNLAEMPAGLQAAELINRIRKPGGGIDYEAAEIFIGKKLRGNETIDELIAMIVKPQRVQKAADGGIMEYNMGGSVLPDGIEMDYRGGGFIPMGSKERADDVPARVSKNEFVMTADAVRAAGGGSVNKGAKKMYELMNNLEARV